MLCEFCSLLFLGATLTERGEVDSGETERERECAWEQSHPKCKDAQVGANWIYLNPFNVLKSLMECTFMFWAFGRRWYPMWHRLSGMMALVRGKILIPLRRLICASGVCDCSQSVTWSSVILVAELGESRFIHSVWLSSVIWMRANSDSVQWPSRAIGCVVVYV